MTTHILEEALKGLQTEIAVSFVRGAGKGDIAVFLHSIGASYAYGCHR